MAKKKSDLFEEALRKLQDLVEKLEKGDLPLEEAMECFSEGIRTAQFCHRKLEEAENKVRVLLKDQQGEWKFAPFEPSRQTREKRDHSGFPGSVRSRGRLQITSQELY